MPTGFNNKALDFVKRHPLASAAASVILGATTYFNIRAPQTGLPDTGTVKTLRLENGSGSQRGICYDDGHCRFSGSIVANGVTLGSGGGGGGNVSATGSTNLVSYFTGLHTLSGSSLMQWDQTNKRLGINTVSPKSTLSVVGTISGSLLDSKELHLTQSGSAATRGILNITANTTRTVSTTKVTNNSLIFLSQQSGAALTSQFDVLSRVPGVSFTIKNNDLGNAAFIGWFILEPQ